MLVGSYKTYSGSVFCDRRYRHEIDEFKISGCHPFRSDFDMSKYERCLKYQNCIPCPEHGECIDGKLTCDMGYVRKGDVCVINENLHIAAIGFLKVIYLLLSLNYRISKKPFNIKMVYINVVYQRKSVCHMLT